MGFFGLEIGKRALMTQQMALTVTGHNIANTNTSGYSRQVANMVTTTPYYSPSLVGGNGVGQLGTGVEVDAIYRARDAYLDRQIHYESQAGSYWNELQTTLGRLETIVNETSDTGLRSVLDQFWEAWQDVSANPESTAVRRVLAERGQAVADAFQHTYKQLTELRADMNANVRIKVDEINSIAAQIAELNGKISMIKNTGQQANDLEDKRDLLLDQLSEIVNIEVKYDEKGRANVRIGNRDLVQGKDYFKLDTVQDNEGMHMVVWQDDQVRTRIESGQLRAYLDARGKTNLSKEKEPSEYKEIIPTMLAELETLAKTVVMQTNAVHNIGYSLNNHGQNPDGKDFFTMPADGVSWSKLMAVSVNIVNDVNNIAASSKPTYDIYGNKSAFGNGTNALMIAQLKQSLNSDLQSITEYIQVSPDISFDLDYEGIGTISVTVNGTDYRDAAERNAAIKKAIESALKAAGVNSTFTVTDTNGKITISSTDNKFEGIDNLKFDGVAVAVSPYAPSITTKALPSAQSPDITFTVMYGEKSYSVSIAGTEYDTLADRANAIKAAIINATGNSSFNVTYTGNDIKIDCPGDSAFTGISAFTIDGVNHGTYTTVPVNILSKPLRPDITMQVIYNGTSQSITVSGNSYTDAASRAAAIQAALETATGVAAGIITVTADGGALVITSTDKKFTGINNLNVGGQDYGSYKDTPHVQTSTAVPLIYQTEIEIELEYDGSTVTVTIPTADYDNADEMAKAIQEAINAQLGVNSFTVTNYDGRLIIASPDTKFQEVEKIIVNGTSYEEHQILSNATDPTDKQVHFQTVDDYWRSIIAELGVTRQDAIRMDENQAIILAELINNREAISGVSIDEEGTNIIKFQNAYNAAARYITTIDEMLDTLINRTGVVGR